VVTVLQTRVSGFTKQLLRIEGLQVNEFYLFFLQPGN